MGGLHEGYQALLVCIFTNSRPEQAFAYLEGKKHRLTDDDITDILKFRSRGYSYQKIADMYGVTFHAIFNRLKRPKKGVAIG